MSQRNKWIERCKTDAPLALPTRSACTGKTGRSIQSGQTNAPLPWGRLNAEQVGMDSNPEECFQSSDGDGSGHLLVGQQWELKQVPWCNSPLRLAPNKVLLQVALGGSLSAISHGAPPLDPFQQLPSWLTLWWAPTLGLGCPPWWGVDVGSMRWNQNSDCWAWQHWTAGGFQRAQNPEQW
jgi:hypothetical protein